MKRTLFLRTSILNRQNILFVGQNAAWQKFRKTVVLLNHSRDPVYYRADRVTMLAATGHAQLETEKPDSSLDLNEKNMAENDLVNELPKSTAGVTSNDKRSTPFRSTRLTSCSQTFAVHSGLTSMFSWLPSGTGVRPRSDW